MLAKDSAGKVYSTNLEVSHGDVDSCDVYSWYIIVFSTQYDYNGESRNIAPLRVPLSYAPPMYRFETVPYAVTVCASQRDEETSKTKSLL
jgi:hypothetical protein